MPQKKRSAPLANEPPPVPATPTPDTAEASTLGSPLRAAAEARFAELASIADRLPTELSPAADVVKRALHELRVHQIELEMQNEELRVAQAALQESRAQFVDLYDFAPVGYVTVAESGLVVHANLLAGTMLGATRSAIVGTAFSRYLDPRDRDTFFLLRQRLVSLGSTPPVDVRADKRDGTTLWVHIAASLAPTTDGAKVCLLSITDITARIKAESAHHASEEKLQSLVELAPVGIAIVHPDNTMSSYNPAFERMLGAPPVQLKTGHFVSPNYLRADGTPMPPEEFPAARAVQEQRAVRNVEVGLVGAHGAITWAEVSAAPLRLPAYNCVVVYTDLTARKRATEQLRQGEARYHGLVEWSYEPLIVHRDGVIVYVNAAAVRLFGATSASQLVGTPILDRVHPEYRKLSSGLMRKVSAEGIDALLLELVFQQLDGSNLNVEVQQTSVVFDGIPAMLASLHDVTAARQADAAIRLHSAALSAAANGIVITDAKGVIVWTNASFGAMSGYSPEETVGKTFRELINSGAQGPGFYQNLWSTILRGETWRGELVNRRKDGTHYTEAETITPLIGLQGAITHFIAVKQDLTERLVLEEQVRQSQKMESVGLLAGGIAHDFNNMLAVILGQTELALAHETADSPRRAGLLEIHAAGSRSADLTRSLLAFARKQRLESRALNVNDVVNGSLEMLRRVIGENVHLEFAPAADLWPVLADAIQLDHILTNLCLNARDAIGDSGSVVVTTSNEIIGEAGHVAKPEAVPGDYVRLTVRDDGSGISQEVLPHIFEPFFTTKGVGKGTGIGLAAVYGAVHQMHGFITVHSERGRGAAFDIYLPRYGKDLVVFPQPVAEADAETPRHASRGQETILLVEDDAGLLLFAQRVLEEEGYRVIAARSPADAVRLAAAEPRLDLLLTDVVMPGMNGLDLMRTLQATRPSLKCVFMSAYRADDMIERYGLPPEGPFVAKPFRLQEIRATVRAELDRS